MSVVSAMKLGLTVGLQIYDRTRPDPLDTVNAQLTTLLAYSTALLDGIDTVQSTLVKTALADRESDIRQALYYLRDSQVNDNKFQAKAAELQALTLSLDAITDLTILANSTSASEIERTAVVPLLISAISTRVQVVKHLKDGAFVTPDGAAIADAGEALRLALIALQPDLPAAEYLGIKKFWQDVEYLDEGEWLQGDAGDNMLASREYTTYLSTPFVGNVLDGYDGDDRLIGYSGNDALRGGNGADVLEGQNGDDVLKGGPGQDRAIFQSVTWSDFQWDDASNNFLTLKYKANRPVTVDLAKTDPQDTGYGLDTIIGIEHVTSGSRNDKLMGNALANSLVSGGGNDRIWGRDGNDRLNGGKGNDKIFGGDGKDQLLGGNGKDSLRGDGGKDKMTGGAGADLFVFAKPTDSAATEAGADLISDFRQGLDLIDLQAIDASRILNGNNTFTFGGTKPFGTSRKGEIYFEKFNKPGTKNDYTLIHIDTDKDRGTEMMVKLSGLINLTADDFIL